ncbi:hypothetical protein JNW89_21005 [Micromonospora sp. 4G55]|nr:hypothetical protein [Micromonospora sp. 4G55]
MDQRHFVVAASLSVMLVGLGAVGPGLLAFPAASPRLGRQRDAPWE